MAVRPQWAHRYHPYLAFPRRNVGAAPALVKKKAPSVEDPHGCLPGNWNNQEKKKYIYIYIYMVFNRKISGNHGTVLNGWWWILSLTMFDCQMFLMTSYAGISKAFPLPSWWHLQWLQWCTNATSAVDQKRKHYLSLLSHSSRFSMTKAVEVQNLMHSMSSWVKLNWPKYR